MAERACELTGFKDAPVLDTLAAAYAEAGRFVRAATTAQKAAEAALAKQTPNLAEVISRRLDRYRQGKAYREQVSVPIAIRP
ncbi:MAG: hypothetical protein ACYTF1_13730 [Planctomycetota bacterium]